MKFDLGNGVQAQSTAGKSTRLKANAIHDVKFMGAVAEDQPSKDKSETFAVLRFHFEDDNGLTFTDTIFEPRPGDDVRKENNFGYENPSAVEELQFKVKHLLSAVAPDVVEKMNSKADGVKIDGWEALRQFVAKQTVKAIGKRTQIKLLGDKENNPRFPGFVLGVTKAGAVYPKTNFIGANLSFTANEEKRMQTALTATPTQMKTVSKTDGDLSLNSDELDLDLDIDVDLV